MKQKETKNATFPFHFLSYSSLSCLPFPFYFFLSSLFSLSWQNIHPFPPTKIPRPKFTTYPWLCQYCNWISLVSVLTSTHYHLSFLYRLNINNWNSKCQIIISSSISTWEHSWLSIHTSVHGEHGSLLTGYWYYEPKHCNLQSHSSIPPIYIYIHREWPLMYWVLNLIPRTWC